MYYIITAGKGYIPVFMYAVLPMLNLRKGLVKLDGSDALLLNGYGSYEIWWVEGGRGTSHASIYVSVSSCVEQLCDNSVPPFLCCSNDPYFNANRLCLLDRGFIFVMVNYMNPQLTSPQLDITLNKK